MLLKWTEEKLNEGVGRLVMKRGEPKTGAFDLQGEMKPRVRVRCH